MKGLELFVKNKRCKNARSGTCKECSNRSSKKWKDRNGEKVQEQAKMSRLLNGEYFKKKPKIGYATIQTRTKSLLERRKTK